MVLPPSAQGSETTMRSEQAPVVLAKNGMRHSIDLLVPVTEVTAMSADPG